MWLFPVRLWTGFGTGRTGSLKGTSVPLVDFPFSPSRVSFFCFSPSPRMCETLYDFVCSSLHGKVTCGMRLLFFLRGKTSPAGNHRRPSEVQQLHFIRAEPDSSTRPLFFLSSRAPFCKAICPPYAPLFPFFLTVFEGASSSAAAQRTHYQLSASLCSHRCLVVASPRPFTTVIPFLQDYENVTVHVLKKWPPCSRRSSRTALEPSISTR